MFLGLTIQCSQGKSSIGEFFLRTLRGMFQHPALWLRVLFIFS